MPQALVVLESMEWGNVHRSIYEGLRVNGLPVWPLVLPRDGCAARAENSLAVRAAAARKSIGMVLTVGPNDHLDESALAGIMAAGKPVVSIQLDDPWALRYQQVRLTGQYAEVLTNDPESCRTYESYGSTAHHLPFGFDPEVFSPEASGPTELAASALFLGSAFPARLEMLMVARAAGIPIQCLGPGWPASWGGGRRYPACVLPHYFRRYQACLNFSDQPDGQPGAKLRPFEIAGSGGGCLLSQAWPGCEAAFTPEVQAIYFATAGELVERARDLLADRGRCASLASAALEVAHKHYTWAERLRPHVARWEAWL